MARLCGKLFFDELWLVVVMKLETELKFGVFLRLKMAFRLLAMMAWMQQYSPEILIEGGSRLPR